MVGQAMAAAPTTECFLNRPRLKEKLRPLQANVRPRWIWRCDPKQLENSIRVVWVGRDLTNNLRPRRRCILRQPGLAFTDPFQYVALCLAVAFQGLLKGLLLKRFL